MLKFMKNIFCVFILLITLNSFAQQNTLKGYIFDEKGNPLIYATAVLLHPEDSTLTNYGITNAQGCFEIKNINSGKYIFQSSYMGYQSIYKNLELPIQGGSNLGAITMKPLIQNLNEVQIKGERIPILIKKDTIEYNASSFKTKPDAVVEDLLKKLPGVEVDRAGNIKAQGENVQKVLVDGKEFFGSDPNIATKNLPSDAIEKVQVFNKKSEETELTGIDDGSYQKTINLILKDGKKNAYFGDLMAGGADNERFQVGAKLYRFTRKNQFAALGMLNNVNKFGFSFRDYLDFNGGLQSLMSGGSGMQMSFGSNDNLPINFGQPINGLITSGAGGINYMYEAHSNNRFNISYLGNGTDKKLIENSNTNNFSPSSSFRQNDDLEQSSKNRAHRLNFGWKNRIDSTQNLTINGSVSLTNGNTKGNSFSESFANDILLNNLYSFTNDNANGISEKVSASYLKKWKNNWKLFKINADVSGSQSLSKTQWDNISRYFITNQTITDKRFQNDDAKLLGYSLSTSVTRKIGSIIYLEPSISAGSENENLIRSHGYPANEKLLIDSLSPNFTKQYVWIRGGFSFKRNTSKSKLNIAAKVQKISLSSLLIYKDKIKFDNLYFVPNLSWDYDFTTGRHLSFNYYSSVNAPSANQLLPVINTLNPLNLYCGNSNLKPEYSHNVQFGWMLFDQFSQTSILANLNASYTNNKINLSRTILPNLSQTTTLVNVSDDYRAGANISYSAPIRIIGANLRTGLNENFNQGINFVNGLQNTNTNFNHSLSISFDNRKKEKWDFSIGGTVKVSDAKYSIQKSLNKTYLNLSGFTEISFTPNDKWYFSFIADVTRYDARSFDKAIDIPLLRAEISRYFLKNKRGVITIEAFDLLDKNKGIERISDINYLLEKQSNVIGRYLMISFKYRINKFEKKSAFEIKTSKR